MSSELETAIQLAKQAGEILKKYFGMDLDVAYKKNKFDPVTEADKTADNFLRSELAKAFPEDEVLSEEHEARPKTYEGRVWMVDPLDGTKAFIAGEASGFSVIIGLLDNHRPRLGVVYVPMTNQLFYAEEGNGSFAVRDGQTSRNKTNLVTAIADARLLARYKITGDNRPLDEAVDSLPFKQRVVASSIGFKLGLLASGQGEAFIHTAENACKWDTLGSQVIITEAGGVVSDIDGIQLDYEKPTVEWDNYVLAASTPELLQDLVRRLNN